MTDYFSTFVEAYLAPRRSAANILARSEGISTAIWLFILAYALSSAATLAVASPMPPEVSSPIAFHIANLMFSFLVFLVISSLVYSLGRMFGGQGTRVQSHVIVAWHAVVTSPGAFLLEFLRGAVRPADGSAPRPEDIDPIIVLLVFAGVMISLWLMASYVTTLHRFQSTWRVASTLMAGALILALLFVAVTGGAGAASLSAESLIP